MKRLLICNCLFIKRCLKRLSFIILLLAIPVLCLLLKNFTDKGSSSITAGIYLEQESTLALQIAENLVNNYESVHFEICPDKETLKKRVINGTYECGYVFSKDFDKKLLNKTTKKIVEVYISPDTLTAALTNEYVFSELFTEYAFSELVDFIKNENIFKNKDMSELSRTLRPIYDGYLYGDDTFSFEYIKPNDGSQDGTELFTSYLMLSVKGVIALLIMFAAFIGTLNLYKDKKIGIFYAFKGISRTFAEMAEIFSVTVLASASGFIAIHACGLSDGFMTEILRLILYTLICTMYCYVLYKLTPNQYIFTSLIPIFVLGSIIFCPIFIDISELLPFVKYISWLFLPKYYYLL